MEYSRIVPTEADKDYYENFFAGFLPAEMCDVHVHTWRKDQFYAEPQFPQRGEDWADLIEQENSTESLKTDYSEMFPDINIHSLLFGWVGTKSNLTENNRYIGEYVRSNPGNFGLAVTRPDWDTEETVRQIEENGLVGMKPYITFVNPAIPTAEITIFDMLSEKQLKLADDRGYVCMLHLPRPGRMADPVNLEQLLTIDDKYPNAKVIVAHLGRCYSDEDLGNAFEILARTKNLCFDFSGNTNENNIRKSIETFGPERVMFGSDLPLTHIHLKRIYENGHYINLINAKERPQINNASYMRTMPEADGYAFFLYEVLGAFRKASDQLGLNRTEINNVLCGNAKRLLNSL